MDITFDEFDQHYNSESDMVIFYGRTANGDYRCGCSRRTLMFLMTKCGGEGDDVLAIFRQHMTVIHKAARKKIEAGSPIGGTCIVTAMDLNR